MTILSRSTIISFMKTFSPRQCVEIIHLCFLDLFGRKTDKALYAVKGGCNLRFYFDSFRYSEDLDIDIQTMAKNTLANKVSSILDSAALKQRLAEKQMSIDTWSMPKQTETTQRWKILLQSKQHASMINTKVEFSRRTSIEKACFHVAKPREGQQYDLGPILCNHYGVDAAYQQKIEALIGRSQTQARDIFDLYLLINHDAKVQLLPDKIKAKLNIAIANLSSITYADYLSQVVAYLMPDYQHQYQPEDTWNTIQMQVYEAIEEGKI